MKTNRFHLLTVMFAVLMSVSSANAQFAEVIDMGLKMWWNGYEKDKAAREKVSEIKPTYEAWVKSLKDYVLKTGVVGDCNAIGFKQLYNNRGQTENFFYECGVEEGDTIAFLLVKSRNKIADCPKEATFRATYDIRKKYLETFALPAKESCTFFKGPDLNPEQKLGEGEMFGGLMGGSAGGLGTKAKGSLKAPSARDIDMGDDPVRSKAEIMAVVNSRMPGLRNIYNKYLKLKPGFSGKVTLKFTIAPGGDIVSIDIVSSTTGYSEFDTAVKNMVATWKWKVIEKSGNTIPTIPFNFTE